MKMVGGQGWWKEWRITFYRHFLLQLDACWVSANYRVRIQLKFGKGMTSRQNGSKSMLFNSHLLCLLISGHSMAIAYTVAPQGMT